MRYQEHHRDFCSWRRQRCLPVLVGLLLTLAVLPGTSLPSTAAQPAKLSRLIQAARQEGVVNFAGPPSLTPAGAQALVEGLNKKYGLHLKLNFTPQNSYNRLIAQIISEAQAGQPPTYDVVLVVDTLIGNLYSRNLLGSYDWRGTFPYISPRSVVLDNQALVTDAIFALPAYNTKLVPPRDVPKTWADLLAPRWKGKVLVPTGMQVWALLAQQWGEKKTDEYIRRLAAQKPVLETYPQTETRLEMGEYPLVGNQLSPLLMRSKGKKAPVAYALKVKPVVVQLDVLTQVKKARHPNAAKLLMGFSLSPEGQAIWWKYGKRTSPFVHGTPAWKFAQGKELLFGNKEFLLEREQKLVERYGKILGVR